MAYLSKIASNYPASGIRYMFDLAAQYEDLINLGVGEPNFETPNNIKKIAIKLPRRIHTLCSKCWHTRTAPDNSGQIQAGIRARIHC